MAFLTHNESATDRILRIAIGLLILALGWLGVVPGVWGIALKLFGWVPLITGIVGWCPFYSLFSISTRRHRRMRPKTDGHASPES